jgi:5-oxoprolinase (ATP-hydrolysing) subunit A
MPLRVDLNADMGEECGDDAALLDVVTTANVAAGGHAGGGDVLRRTVGMAAQADVAVGAHPSYPDRAEFGRVSRADAHEGEAIAAFVRDQVLAVATACTEHGVALAHVKAHGALYHDAGADPVLAAAFLDGVQASAARLGVPSLAVMGMPGTALHRECAARGVAYLPEAFADRAYSPDGTLLPRSEPGAVLLDPEIVAARVLRLVTEGRVRAVDGTDLLVPASTVCLHGDTAGAVEMARMVRRRLEEHGVVVAAGRTDR